MIQPLVTNTWDFYSLLEEDTGDSRDFFIHCKGEYVCLVTLHDDFHETMKKRKTTLRWFLRTSPPGKPSRGDTKYSIASNRVSQEEFFDHLLKEYPQHYEWIIWNIDALK